MHPQALKTFAASIANTASIIFGTRNGAIAINGHMTTWFIVCQPQGIRKIARGKLVGVFQFKDVVAVVSIFPLNGHARTCQKRDERWKSKRGEEKKEEFKRKWLKQEYCNGPYRWGKLSISFLWNLAVGVVETKVCPIVVSGPCNPKPRVGMFVIRRSHCRGRRQPLHVF